MATAIAFAAFASIRTYTNHHETTITLQKSAQILSAWSNLGNNASHWLLVAYIAAQSGGSENHLYWEREQELGVSGSAALGVSLLHNRFIDVSLVWNLFIACAEILVPFVWLRFVEEGLTTWPYTVIFLWWIIFATEVTAFGASWTHYLMRASDDDCTSARTTKKEN